MKALTLTQPWATAIMLKIKRIETRSWQTYYRGQIAIHAAKGFPKSARLFAETERAIGRIPERLPLGAIIGLADIKLITTTENPNLEISALERLYGDYSRGRFAWILTDIIPFEEPIPCKGMLGLWEVPKELGLE